MNGYATHGVIRPYEGSTSGNTPPFTAEQLGDLNGHVFELPDEGAVLLVYGDKAYTAYGMPGRVEEVDGKLCTVYYVNVATSSLALVSGSVT